jgi:hypothetical protein
MWRRSRLTRYCHGSSSFVPEGHGFIRAGLTANHMGGLAPEVRSFLRTQAAHLKTRTSAAKAESVAIVLARLKGVPFRHGLSSAGAKVQECFEFVRPTEFALIQTALLGKDQSF